MLELFFEYELFAFAMVILCALDDSSENPNIVVSAFFMVTFIPTLLFAIIALSIHFKKESNTH